MRPWYTPQLLTACLVLFPTLLFADQLEYVVSGVDEPMLTNVLNHVSAYRVGSGAKLSRRLQRQLIEDAKTATLKAMRPYGYFNPVVSVQIDSVEAGKWRVGVEVRTGPPVLIQELQLELKGPGRDLQTLKDWFAAFPLAEGQVLDQQAWDTAKLDVMALLEEAGFFNAEFSRHSMRVDTVANTARLQLVVETGLQAVMGKVTFKQDILDDKTLASLQRFQQGDPYNIWLLGKFRLDLWRSGYFEDIEVVERRELSIDPPRVDLVVNLTPRKENTYQSTVGFGTDTLVRLQFVWSRHLLSPRGDKFDLGLGWQQRNNEYALQANYRLPRKTDTPQFWIGSFGVGSKQQEMRVSASGDLENRFTIARGRVDDYTVRFGKTRVRNLKGGIEQLFETTFLQLLNDQQDYTLTGNFESQTPFGSISDSQTRLLNSNSQSLAIGMDWDWPVIRGSGFHTEGHHERARIFTSNQVWGSDVDYSQVYLSSRWNWLAGDRWKFLLRAEAGYSDADTDTVNIPTEQGELSISVTDLPNLYRFKAGGNNSVRGYSFELLDTNGLGSNNILTASAELEFRIHDDWSVAAFFDIGNAFNDWSNPDLKLGSGFGLRWYSVIGALRLDVARGWDLQGEPWRIHLTIGTPLL